MLLFFLAGVDLLAGILLYLVVVGPELLRLVVATVLVVKAILSLIPNPIILPGAVMGFFDLLGGVLLYFAFGSIPLPEIIKAALILILIIKGVATVISSTSSAMT